MMEDDRMKRPIVSRVLVQCFAFSLLTLCVLAQDQGKENAQAIAKPKEIGQFFSLLKDGKLIPLQEETKVSASATFTGDISIKIKEAESKVKLDSADNVTFVVHLSDKSISHYSLYSLKKEKDKRTMRVSNAAQRVLFSAIEYADGYFQLTPKTSLAPGEYVFFSQEVANSVDHFYSFEVK
jgi:hypothetical protein